MELFWSRGTVLGIGGVVLIVGELVLGDERTV